MALYLMEEEEAWKCPKHPSKKRRSGVCPACLRHRLGVLCPNCGNSRPCSCASNTASSSSSSSSSFPFFSGDGEPSLRRSRSVAIPFLRSGSFRAKTPSFLSVLKRSATKKAKENEEFSNFADHTNSDENSESKNRIEDFSRMITRSRSVSAGTTATATGLRRSDVGSSPAKWKLWNFPSPMKVLRSARVMVQDRSPLHRG